MPATWGIFKKYRTIFERAWQLEGDDCDRRFMAEMARWLSSAPAALMHVDAFRGSIAPGKYADFVVWTLGSILCTNQMIRSGTKDNCIYQNEVFECEVTHTYLRGVPIFKNGQLLAHQGEVLLSADQGRLSASVKAA